MTHIDPANQDDIPQDPPIVDPPVDPASADPPQDPPSDTDPSTDEEKAFAHRLGWRSEDEWQGAPASRRPREFLTARQYIAKVEGDLPVLRERLRHQDGEIVKMARTIEDVNGKVSQMTTVMGQLHEANKTARQRGYEQARRELIAERDRAATVDIDPEAYKAANEKLEQLEAEHASEAQPAAAPAAPAAKPDDRPRIPEVEAWQAKRGNEWFQQNVVLNQAAIQREAELQSERPDLSLTGRLEEVSKWIKEHFSHAYPQYFPDAQRPAPPPKPQNPRRQAPAAVGAGNGAGPAKPQGMTYENLPPDAKQACDMLCATIKGFTREDYLKEYGQ